MIHIIAHQGASALEPENTLRAFERAIGMGVTMLEMVLPCCTGWSLRILAVSRAVRWASFLSALAFSPIDCRPHAFR